MDLDGVVTNLGIGIGLFFRALKIDVYNAEH